MKKIFRKKLSGFTLVEIVVVMAMISLLSGVSIISLSASRNSLKLRTSQSELASAIKLAQSYALQGRMHNGSMPSYYGVTFFNAADVVNYAICGCANIDCTDCVNPSHPHVAEKYSLKNGVKVTSSDPWVTFKIPHGSVHPAAGRKFRMEIGGKQKEIEVNGYGHVIEK